jgi:hypothetical protein
MSFYFALLNSTIVYSTIEEEEEPNTHVSYDRKLFSSL